MLRKRRHWLNYGVLDPRRGALRVPTVFESSSRRQGDSAHRQDPRQVSQHRLAYAFLAAAGVRSPYNHHVDMPRMFAWQDWRTAVHPMLKDIFAVH